MRKEYAGVTVTLGTLLGAIVGVIVAVKTDYTSMFWLCPPCLPVHLLSSLAFIVGGSAIGWFFGSLIALIWE